MVLELRKQGDSIMPVSKRNRLTELERQLIYLIESKPGLPGRKYAIISRTDEGNTDRLHKLKALGYLKEIVFNRTLSVWYLK